MPSKSGCVTLNQRHMHQGSPLLNILTLCRATSTVIFLLHQATFRPFIQPTSVYSLAANHSLSPSTSFSHTYTNPFSPLVQTISIPSAHSAHQPILYSSSSTHLFIRNFIHSWHSHKTSQTFHLKNIHFPSPYTCCSYSFLQILLRIYDQFSIAQHPFQCSPSLIACSHSSLGN